MVRAYWEQARMDEDPRLQHHPLRAKDYKNWCIPAAMHEDGVPFKKAGPHGSLDVRQWSSLTAFGTSTWDTRFLSRP